ncbi:MAG: nucleotidyltransferase family protein [Bryobacteraceae bacterium]
MSAQISAVVLAAGMGARMGAVKPLLPLAGKTLLEQVLDTLRVSDVREIVVVLGFAADEIRARVPLHSVKTVLNDGYREGMASSLRTGISAIDPASEAALIVLADQPFVQPGTIGRLIAEHRARHPLIAVPIYDGNRGNPVLINRSLFHEMLQLSGDTGCRSLFAAHADEIVKVPVDDPGILIDLDTKEDLDSGGER